MPRIAIADICADDEINGKAGVKKSFSEEMQESDRDLPVVWRVEAGVKKLRRPFGYSGGAGYFFITLLPVLPELLSERELYAELF